MATPSAIPTNSLRDCVTRVHRVTRENRSLWYQMTVLQQPERARACGSGMKANSDRRPVDPPPVVELRIIEGQTVEDGKDITFDYNANFFLYASLEHSRPIAHGRVQTPAANNPPILTGVPASGMAYLDRPTEAGYFIFPDLSVRHEGRYRLSFSLFETTKEEKDFDLEPADGDLPPGVDWRMEIKTLPFSVFSAKKFPGLMESTQLSKTVADQGCRVRIRRDVRMRKRDGKSGFDRRDDDYPRRTTATPAAEDPNGLRARSLSNSSEHRVSYSDSSRRPSAVDVYPPPPPPPAYEASSASSRHLSFGDPSAPQYPAPRQYAHPGVQLTPVSPTGPYPPTSLSPYVKPETPGYANVKQEPSSVYAYPSRSLPGSCPSPMSSMKQDAYDRRQSNGAYVPPSPSVYSSMSIDNHSRRESLQSYTSASMVSQHSRLAHMPSNRLPISALMAPMSPIEAQTDPLPEPPNFSLSSKRKYGNVFSSSQRPLHNGQRQQDPHYGHSRRGVTPEPDQGMYSRADGKMSVVTFNQYRS
ncbi:hypothetical protein G7046_g7971 [Stylonectria norvegica]|nr:hypothetical protein G7046_g7971 [Stylonectria norvegica]